MQTHAHLTNVMLVFYATNHFVGLFYEFSSFIRHYSLWHNSLKTISIFRDFGSKTIREDYNFFQIYLDGNIPVRLKAIQRTSRVEFCDKTFSNVS